MVMKLPEKFLEWNYYGRAEFIRNLLDGKLRNANDIFVGFTRHTPALGTARIMANTRNSYRQVFVNVKIVGTGYVLKKEFLPGVTEILLNHIKSGDELMANVRNKKDEKGILRDYSNNGMNLVLKHLYLNPEEAVKRVDFTKMSTSELAVSKRYSSKHTWTNVQNNRNYCLTFYGPEGSFELHGPLKIHTNCPYQRFVNAVHDTVHFTTPQERQKHRPVYIFDIEEVFDNSVPEGWGTYMI